MGRVHDEGRVIEQLSKYSAITIDAAKKVIEVLQNGIIGNGTWGKIDFLVNHCGFTLLRVSAEELKARREAERQRRNAKRGTKKPQKQDKVNNSNKSRKEHKGFKPNPKSKHSEGKPNGQKSPKSGKPAQKNSPKTKE